MKKYIFFLVGLCCALLPAMADQPELLELKASDAYIIGHVLDKKTGEHLSYNNRPERNYHWYGDGCHRTLFPEKPSRREFCARSQFGGV